MTTIGIELCDAGLLAAAGEGLEPALLAAETNDWPGFVYHDGRQFWFGRPAEDVWFVHPRRVNHSFLAKLTHEASTLNPTGKPPSFSELTYHFLKEFTQSVAVAGPFEKVVLAVPGAYLKDAAVEDEKVGLLLGIASELKFPLAGIIDLGCAALCDPQAGGFAPALPVIVVDLHLQGTELSLFTNEQMLTRTHFLHLPQFGLSQLLKHLTAAMGNRFLRQTAFDILEDGRIEQTFFRQTKNFLVSRAGEQRFEINTATRNYEMLVKQEQLAGDAQGFVQGVLQSVQAFVQNAGYAPASCTIALTDRATWLPGLENRLRAAGFRRLLRLPRGAAARGAARIGAGRLQVPADMADVPVETAVPSSDARRAVQTPWEARLQKPHLPEPRQLPTHAVLDGVGQPIGDNGSFAIGPAALRANLILPDAFHSAQNCLVTLVREEGRLWFEEFGVAQTNGGSAESLPRTPVEAGDRLTIRCGTASAEILFVHCREAAGTR